MARLLRPYIPIKVRLAVALRQARLRGFVPSKVFFLVSDKMQLQHLLSFLFRGETHHLDHDPALENRTKAYDATGHVGYRPNANDPDYLIYRTKAEHQIKTNVRGDGAQYSDRALAARERRRQKPKRKYNWPKGRKIARRVK